MGIGRAVAVAAIGITGVGLLGACGWNFATDSYSDTNSVGEPVESVRFASDAGNVTIRTGDSVSVRREVHYNDEKAAERTARVRDGVLTLDSCGKRGCWIDYEVTVPAGTTVDGGLESGSADISGVAKVNLRSESGEVSVRDVAGAVNVESQSGTVTVAGVDGAVVVSAESGNVTTDDVRGDVTLHVSSGNVEAYGLGGKADVESDSGQVVVELTTAADVRVQAESGNVEVTVPDGAYRVATSADSGNVDSEIDDDPAGGHRIDLRTDSGNISVSRA